MTRDEIIEMANKAELCQCIWIDDEGPEIASLVTFSKLVAAREREACAKVCDDKVDAEYATGKVDHNEMGWTQSCAIAIRARSEA